MSRLGPTHSRALLILGCLLTAGTVASLLIAAAPSSPSHETLLDRNPVDAGALQPVSLPAPPEEIEKSQLQLSLTLLGTFAAGEPSRSRATLRHRESQETLVVGVGDVIEGHALVVQIERERLLLRDNGSIVELRLDGEHAPSDPSRVATSEGSGVPVPAATGNPVALLADLDRALLDSTIGQARVLPELEGDHVVGLRVSAIQEDSRLAQLGIEADDVITQFNGIAIDSPFLALHAVREMLSDDGYHVMVRRGDELEHFDSRPDDAGI